MTKSSSELRTITRVYYRSLVLFSFFPTPLILRLSIYRSWFVACCSTGVGYVCLQLCPFVPLPFAKRILTWNGGINAGTWNRSAPRLTSNGFKWTLLSRTATAKKNCAALVLLSIQSWSLGCTRQLRYFLSLFLEVFPFIWESVIRCGVSRFTRVALVSASGQLLFLSSQKRDARGKWKKIKNNRWMAELQLCRWSRKLLEASSTCIGNTESDQLQVDIQLSMLHTFNSASGQFWFK